MGMGRGGVGFRTHTCCKGMNLGGGKPVNCNSLGASIAKEPKGQVDHLDFERH